MKHIEKRKEIWLSQLICIIWIFLFIFQDVLCDISSVFSYVDEAPFLLFCVYCGLNILKKHKIHQKRNIYFNPVIVFVMTGLLGNVIYQYQSWNLVLVDLMTNLKFLGAIAYFTHMIKENVYDTRHIPNAAKNLTVLLTMLFVIDRFINIFPSEYRYGIKSAKLFFGHPTYFAGACAFLVGLMTIYDADNYKPYILMDLIMMVFTLRSKAIVSAIVYIMLYIVIKKLNGKLKVWQIVILCIVGVACAWSQIYFYFIKLGGQSARSVMFLTSLRIMKDYFPIGTGFATYASHSAAVNYSPVYSKYGFNLFYELRNVTNGGGGTFFDDQFWPIIFGQTGIIGTICYICILIAIFKKIQKLYKCNKDSYMTGLFIYIYLLISSVAEPAFNNSIAIPLAMALAIAMNKTKATVNQRYFKNQEWEKI